MLTALRYSQTNGLPEPTLIPVGLHYSNSNKFRERGAVILERGMNLPDIPPLHSSEHEQTKADQEWVLSVTQSIESELKRASLSKTTWEERRLIWLARASPMLREPCKVEKIQRPSYAESVIEQGD